MKNKILALIDFNKIDTLLNGFKKTTGLATAILNLEGTVLSHSEWRKLCAEFYQKNPETSNWCSEIKIELAEKLAEGEDFHFYKCYNGLVEVAIPIYIEGEHFANLFSGLFFNDEPNLNVFNSERLQYGFEEKTYNKALQLIPVISSEKIKDTMRFLLETILYIIEMAFQKAKQMELNDSLAFNKLLVESIIDNSPSLIYVADVEGEFILINKEFQKIFDLPKSDIVGKIRQQIMPEEIAEQHRNNDIEVIQSKKPIVSEEDNIEADGKHYYISQKFPLFDLKGDVIAVGGISTDITEKKNIEEALKKSEFKYKNLFENSVDGIIVFNEQSEILELNSQICEILDYNREELIQLKGYEFIHEEDLANKDHAGALEQLLQGKTLITYYRLRKKDGSYIPTELSTKMIGEGQFLTVIRNITDRKLAEKALQESEDKFKQIFLTSPDFVTINNIVDGTYLNINDNFLEKSGYTRQEIIGKTANQLNIWTNPEDRSRMFEIIYKNGNVDNLEAKFTLKNGAVIDGLLSASLLTINNNPHILTITRDITQLKLVEQSFKETAANLRSMIDNRDDSIWSIDRDFNYIIFNSTYENIINNQYNIQLKKGMSSKENLTKEQADFWIPMFESVFEGESVTFEFSHMVNNELHYFQTSLNPIIEDNIITGASGLSIDITHRKTIEDALKLSEEKFEKSFRLSPYMVSLSAMDGKVIEVNERVFETLGYSRSEFLGNSTTVLPIWVDPEERVSFANLLKEDGNLHEMEVKFRKKSGEIGDYLLSASIIELNEQKLFLSIIHDITERKNSEKFITELNASLENKVKKRTKQLETINKELETFTYSVSHDLKAPLRGIDGYSKLLADIYKLELNQEAQSFIQKIRSSTQQMNEIIDDLLEYSRLERSQLNIGKLRLKDLIESVLSVYNTELEASCFIVNKKNIDIEIIADSKGFIMAFRNLIENSIKFTKGKTNPTIKIEIKETELSWIISVNDNGIGFDMKYHNKIFDIFQRLQRVEDFPGTGIGLALVSKAMQRLNGKTWAESIPNIGSTFYLEIPKQQ